MTFYKNHENKESKFFWLRNLLLTKQKNIGVIKSIEKKINTKLIKEFFFFELFSFCCYSSPPGLLLLLEATLEISFTQCLKFIHRFCFITAALLNDFYFSKYLSPEKKKSKDAINREVVQAF